MSGANWGCDQVGSACVQIENGIIVAANVVFDDRTLVVGIISGPTGDIAAGLSKMLVGKSVGGGQAWDGTKRLGLFLAADVAGFIYGNTWGKASVFYRATQQDFNARYYLTPAVIPNMGNYGGANWGTSQQPLPIVAHSLSKETGFYPLFRVPTKIEYASFLHDFDLETTRRSKAELPLESLAHLRWIGNSWFGEGAEPGPFGQAYRAIGTPAFLIFAGISAMFGD